METELTGGLSEEIKERIKAQVPAGRFGSPEDISEAVAFLVGEGTGYITGQTLTVDGGMVMQ